MTDKMMGRPKSDRVCDIAGCTKPHYGKGFCQGHYWRWKRSGQPLGGNVSRGKKARWIKEVAVHYKADDCLVWEFKRHRTGYGVLQYQGKSWRAHRLVCQLVHGDPPTPEHEAAHSCGNGHLGCVNPNHLRWATHKENGRDTVWHGRAKASARRNAKLTEQDVSRIRLMADQYTQSQIAARFSIDQSSVSHILRGKIWK